MPPLSDSQILRYGRQILVKHVGGKGQDLLMSRAVYVSGSGCAQAVAMAYLAAGGTPFAGCSSREVNAEDLGFLLGVSDVGKPLSQAISSSLSDANADALSVSDDNGTVIELPGAFSGQGPWVAIGWQKAKGAVVYRSIQGCAECFQKTVETLHDVAPSNSPISAILGAIGAVVFQRLVLGISNDFGGLLINEQGSIEAISLLPCSVHADGVARTSNNPRL